MKARRSAREQTADARAYIRRMLPVEVSDLTPAWFSRALEREVTGVSVLDSSSGTTGRARLALQGEPGVPTSVFVKLAPFDERQRKLVDMTGMGVAEARFYQGLAREVPVRVPDVWFADVDDSSYVMVLEDLTASGCRFPGTGDADIERRARDIVEQLATLHAPYWDSPRFQPDQDLAWLTARGMSAGGGGRGFIGKALDRLGDEMGPAFRRIAEIYIARAEDIGELWSSGAGTLIHGDPHLGNLFVDVAAGDRTGFLDWAVVCRAPGIRDVAYVLCNSVPTDVREANERALVDRYCELLAGGGVTLDAADAWRQYRLFAVYSWVAAAATAGMGSKWQSVDVGLSATRRATAACEHLDSAGLVESLLG
jgi:Phosphotransferase enzyme family